jgi:hypothetical protein
MQSIIGRGFGNDSGASEDLPEGPRPATRAVVPQRAEESLPKPGVTKFTLHTPAMKGSDMKRFASKMFITSIIILLGVCSLGINACGPDKAIFGVVTLKGEPKGDIVVEAFGCSWYDETIPFAKTVSNMDGSYYLTKDEFEGSHFEVYIRAKALGNGVDCGWIIYVAEETPYEINLELSDQDDCSCVGLQ